VARQLTKPMTIVTLRSITRTLEKDLPTTEFVVLPIFGHTRLHTYSRHRYRRQTTSQPRT
jgi:hypothetical protein